MSQEYYLYHRQDKKEYFTLPSGWTVSHFVEAEDEDSGSSIEEMATDALSHPEGTPPLCDMVSRATRIAILVDDATRPTPVAPILSCVLSAIEKLDFPREGITILTANGTHEPMSREVLAARLGGKVAEEYKVIQHDAWQKDLVPVKIPGDSRMLRINPIAARADLKVGISSILPHAAAGYGGGPKIVMPGVSNFEFARDHHMKNVMLPGSSPGRTKGNPFHEEVMRAAQAIGLDFSLNCVYDRKGRIHRIIGGSLEAAFERAVQLCRRMLGHRFEEKVDITITSAYPHTHGHQFFKGMNAAAAVTEKTGAILLLAPISAPISRDFINSFHVLKERSKGDPEGYVIDHLKRGVAYLPDKSVDFNMAMSAPFRRKEIRTIIVSPFIPKEEAEIMGLDHAPTVEAGIAMLRETHPKARVAVFPTGGLILPLAAWESEK